jgi:hypothetical protein
LCAHFERNIGSGMISDTRRETFRVFAAATMAVCHRDRSSIAADEEPPTANLCGIGGTTRGKRKRCANDQTQQMAVNMAKNAGVFGITLAA